jgi:hypothetical protein
MCLVAVSTLACSSAAPRSSPEPRQTERVTVVFPAAVVSFVRLNDVSTTTIAAPKARVWTNLLLVHEELGLAASEIDARAGTAVYIQQGKPSLGGKLLSAYFDCGSTVTGPRTATHSVAISVRESLESRGADTTLVRTSVNAFARSRGTSSDNLQCSSTGKLEEDIAKRLAARVQ